MDDTQIDRVLNDVRTGKRVVVFCRNNVAVRATLNQAAGRLDAAPATKVRRANGREAIDIGRGHVSFITVAGGGYRGLTADIVVLDCEPTADLLERIAPLTVLADVRQLAHASA